MPNFIPNNYRQKIMIALNFEDQLQPGTFEYALHHLIENKLDLSVFYPRYKNEEKGRPAYDPAVLLKIVLFAYSKGITSSREIQWCCRQNLIFKALACDSEPHFTTIAHFISSKPSDIQTLFEQILLICDQEGLLGHELFAIDGCKLPSDAAKTWSGTFKELGEKRDKLKRLINHHMTRHQQNDQDEKEEDDLREKRTQQTIDTLNKAAEKIETFLNENEPRQGKGKRKTEVKSNITDNESAKMTTSKGTLQGFNGVASVDKKHQIIIDAQAFGEGQEHHVLQPVLATLKERYQRLGLSDNLYQDGIIVTADTGYANEENMKYLHEANIDAYIPDNQFRSRDPKFADQKKKYGKRHPTTKRKTPACYPPSEFKFNSKEKRCECPAGKVMWLKNEKKDKHGNDKIFFEGRISDCRSCELKEQCMRKPDAINTTGHGRQVSFIIKQRTPAPNHTDWMKARVDSEKGKQIYSHRMSVVEPVFANMCSNKGLNRFSLRGKNKVQGQWQLYCLVHNIEKLANYGQLAH